MSALQFSRIIYLTLRSDSQFVAPVLPFRLMYFRVIGTDPLRLTKYEGVFGKSCLEDILYICMKSHLTQLSIQPYL